ncbi:MAG: hypothetical protein GIX02_06055, partial [Candidatus Eremiobacteraeota bacterium]|nr:hypothetical protein [Candidatus Eremiobacteraeota bacterium]
NTVAGRTTYLMAPIPLALVDIRAGKLHALGVSTMKRSSSLPEVPTIAEAGVAGFDFPNMGACRHTGRSGRQVVKRHRTCHDRAGPPRPAGNSRGRSDQHDAA